MPVGSHGKTCSACLAQFACDKKQTMSNIQNPDRYQWLKQDFQSSNDENIVKRYLNDMDLKQALPIVVGPILEI